MPNFEQWTAEEIETRWKAWLKEEKAVKRSLKMSEQDPLVRAVKKAYRSGPLYPVEKLLEEESRWKRKATIAQNKLLAVRLKINRLLLEQAQAALKEGKP